MGAVRENDGALTKTAWMVRALVDSRERIAAGGGAMTLELAGQASPDELVLEGGQGFLPTHDIGEVMSRVARAAERGAATYLRRMGRADEASSVVKTTYDKLHNAAFDGDPDSAAMRTALAAAKACGMWRDQPITGWNVSCDARLFATEYPGMPVLTSGPGQLTHAHSDEEQLDLEELRTATEFVALYLMDQVMAPGDAGER
jgi:acetylornithine deacetylase/succinyl-diaminopimelate desuccinylase-like protein